MEPEPRVIDLASVLQPIHQALGEALSIFSGMESNLAFLFAKFMESREFDQAVIAYDAIGLLSPKIRVLKAVARRYFEASPAHPQANFETLKRILGKVEAKQDFRNKLAHWRVGYWTPTGLPTLDRFDEFEGRLLPPWFSAKHLSARPDESVSLKEIRNFIRRCAQIHIELSEFAVALQEMMSEPSDSEVPK